MKRPDYCPFCETRMSVHNEIRLSDGPWEWGSGESDCFVCNLWIFFDENEEIIMVQKIDQKEGLKNWDLWDFERFVKLQVWK